MSHTQARAVHPLPATNAAVQGGVTYAQAMRIFELFHFDSLAAPTVAHDMGIPYEAVCKVLGGSLWPQCRRFWFDKYFP